MQSSLRARSRLVKYVGFPLLVAILYYVISHRRTFVRYEGRLPFVWEPSYNRTIRHYLSTYPTHGTMVVTGPYQSGKSRSFDLLSAELLSQGRLSINVDLSNVNNIYQIVGAFKMAVYKSIAAVYPALSTQQQRQIQEVLQDTGDEPLSERMYKAFSAVLDLSMEKETCFSLFLELLDSYATVLRPSLFIHGIENCYKVSPRLYEAVMSKLASRGLYENFVPIVLELRDSQMRFNSEFSHDSFKFTDVIPFQEPTHRLVISNRAFSAIEMRNAYRDYGGHGGTLEHIFEDLKEGLTIDDTLNKTARANEAFVLSKLDEKMSPVVQQICKAGFNVVIEDLTTIKPLISSGILYVSANHSVQAAHKGIASVLCNIKD